jgi:hypothetical protein
MGSLFSGSTESKVKIPKWLEEAAKANLGQAQDIASIGYTPYYGADVAAFNPMQAAGFQNTADASRAFGLSAPTDAMAGMPQAQNFGGVMGYSSQPLFADAVSRFGADRPGQKSLIDSFFIDPRSGAQGSGSIGNSGTNAPSVRNTGTVATQQANQRDINSPVGTSTMPVQTYDSYDDFAAQQASSTSPMVQPVTTESVLGGMQPNTTMPSPTDYSDYDQFMQDSFDANLNASLDPSSPLSITNYTQEDPSFMDSAGYYAGQLGRGMLDNTLIGRGYELATDGSLSDKFFGESVKPVGDLNFTPQAQQQIDGMFPVNPMLTDLNAITQGYQAPQPSMVSFDPTAQQSQQLEAMGLTMNPQQGLSIPSSFSDAGNMMGQSAASQSPIKSLFDSFDKQQERDEELKKLIRTYETMR